MTMAGDKTKKTKMTKKVAANDSSTASSPSYPSFISPHGGYESLLAYRKSQLEQEFLQAGGLRERMTHARLLARSRANGQNA